MKCNLLWINKQTKKNDFISTISVFFVLYSSIILEENYFHVVEFIKLGIVIIRKMSVWNGIMHWNQTIHENCEMMNADKHNIRGMGERIIFHRLIRWMRIDTHVIDHIIWLYTVHTHTHSIWPESIYFSKREWKREWERERLYGLLVFGIHKGT